LVNNFNDAQPAKAANLRRSQRVCLNVALEILLAHTRDQAAPELTKTLIVNAHGALILLHSPVEIGDSLRVRNVKTKEERACRVVDVGAGTTGVPEVGVEFLEPSSNFWHIAFPPADWNPRGSEAKAYGPQRVTNLPKPAKP
jgi:hypothetical protein